MIVLTGVVLAQRTIPLSIDRLVKDAGVIIDATVVKTETGKDPQSGLLVTWVTVNVNENFFGVQGKEYTFKQYGGEANGIANYPAHLPRYSQGERSILFLTAPSKIGMQSPVGMEQGVFMVYEEGKTKVKNSVINPSLLKGVAARKGFEKSISSYKKEDGSLDYGEFSQLIRSYVQQLK
jgi:hypothetical protein